MTRQLDGKDEYGFVLDLDVKRLGYLAIGTFGFLSALLLWALSNNGWHL